ncbi:MAG TPA: M23 family metallopeptidase [Caulobacteraceae bacterium]|nr:M23 family metallopeptidase [Caulobacteraceae bacterium]
MPKAQGARARPALFWALGTVLLVFAAGRVLGGATPAPRPTLLRVVPRAGEPLRATLIRAGLPAGEAAAATVALSEQGGPAQPAPGASVQMRVERGRDGAGLRLIALSLITPHRPVAVLDRAADGAFRLAAAAQASIPASPTGVGGTEVTRVVQGPMEDVLYSVRSPAEAASSLVAPAMRLFARKLDVTRDIGLGDRVRFVIASQADAQGRGVGPDRLAYAEIDTAQGATRFYAHRTQAGAYQFVGADGDTGEGALLRTPLEIARLTSGFGMRRHPLLGYSRMHEGLDFGAPIGTPVLAAGDAVVEEARWAGGYGRWIRLRHAGGVETGYGHLSGWTSGLRPGETVSQGQVIGYVGSTGLSTGSHLHFEVIDHGRPVDPRGFAARAPVHLTGVDLVRFAAEKEAVARALRAPPSA